MKGYDPPLVKKLPAYRIILALTLLLILLTGAKAQDTSGCIDISKVSFVKSISRLSLQVYMAKDDSLQQVYASLPFKMGMRHTGNIPTGYVDKKAVLKFVVCNTADTAVSVWFFPGFFYWDVRLYQEIPGGIRPLSSVSPSVKDNLSYREISLGPHETTTLYAELSFVRTHINTLRPRLIHAQRLDSFITDVRADHDTNNMVTFVFSGLLLMMILFSIATYFQGGNKEFLFYSGYAFFLGGMLFTKAYYNFHPSPISYFFEGYLDFVMQSIGIIFYMFFMQRFLVTRRHHPFLYHLYNFGIGLLVLSILLFTYCHYFTNSFMVQNGVENFTKLLLLGMTVVFLIYSLRQWKDKLLRYLFWGNLCLFVFALLSQVTAMTGVRILPGIWGTSLFYYELGLFLELVFFLAGLNHKNRRLIIAQTKERERLKADNLLKEYEKEMAVFRAQQGERERISADMHDELGSGMTAIRLMSEIARNKMKENTPVEIEKISQSANDVLNKMNAIIWSMNSGNDTLDNLVSYIRSYALEYFENTPMQCKVNTPENIPNVELTGDKRRNIFLCVKETLNNALKHSKASLITIDIETNHVLRIKIADNGNGIDLQNLRRFGNGLKNIAKRMEGIGGSFTIQNENGTVTILTLPLPEH